MDVKEFSFTANLSPEERGLLVQALVDALLPYLKAATFTYQADTSTSDQETPISKKEACRYLSCSEPTMTKWMAKGKVPFHRKGRRVYFFKSEMLKSLEQPLRRA